jgi:hypothetical protein
MFATLPLSSTPINVVTHTWASLKSHLQVLLDRHAGANVLHVKDIYSPAWTLSEDDELMFGAFGPSSLLSENPVLVLSNTTTPPTLANAFCLVIFRQCDIRKEDMMLVHEGPTDTSPSYFNGNLYLWAPLPSRPPVPFHVLSVTPNADLIHTTPGSIAERLLFPSSHVFQAEKNALAALLGPTLARVAPQLHTEAFHVTHARELHGFSLFELRALRRCIDVALLDVQPPPAVFAEPLSNEEEEAIEAEDTMIEGY